MFDVAVKRLPWVVAAIMAVTLTGQAALAQEGEEFATSAGINADRVDGLNAVKYTSKKNKRKSRLMAFSASGYLPANIVKGTVATLAQLGDSTGAANEADNPVHWNQIQGIPPAVLTGDTTVSAIVFETPVVPPGGQGIVAVVSPVGLDIETSFIPTAANTLFWVANNLGQPGYLVGRTPDGTGIGQVYILQNIGTVASTVKLRATAWNETYVSPSAVKSKVKVTYYKKLPKKYRP